MSNSIKLAALNKHSAICPEIGLFNTRWAEFVQHYHRTIPGYSQTPLKTLKQFSQSFDVGNIYVKDESFRFGLNAFKALGSSYCMATLLAERLGLPLSQMTYEKLTTPDVKKRLGTLTFVTATDGNHGRGVAWSAKTLGHKSIVLMPKGTATERLDNIKKLGANASITQYEYDDTVKMAAEVARQAGGVLVQDTAWDGYEDIPTRIMQGYLTLGLEIVEQLNGVTPTHIFLQAGVGSMAAAVAAFFANFYGENRPVITIVEPHGADCLYRTAFADDGEIHVYEGELQSIMAGLCCGIPCTVAWRLLKHCADFFVSMPDSVAANGMRILGAPMGDDPRIISGESGASTFGLVSEILRKPENRFIKNALGIDAQSNIVCISTEGDTDRSNYRRIVWDGAYCSN